MAKMCQGFLTWEELGKLITSGLLRTSYYKADSFVRLEEQIPLNAPSSQRTF